MEQKLKKCVVCGQDRKIFSHGKCMACWKKSVANDTMKKMNDARKRGIKPRKVMSQRMKTILADDNSICSQPLLFRDLWEKNRGDDGQYYCQFTGEDVTMYHEPHPMWVNACLHILPKGKYPYFKFRMDNLRLGHPDFHALVDAGTEKQRKQSRFPQYAFEMFFDLQERLKVEYMDFKRDKGLP